ncbi:MAG: 3-methyladenine DNA glycosylase [Idiomarina sp. T82-3]|uniref:3-methyladenine DNA glycosylase n=1 Tax=Idiomarina TaxID=135575 RepID=UPI000791146B|nr:3-methyladenine DNA glycosylase [Idiomarina sp. T82-3]KXS35827.1 MAG: 3-methyladenine DNA glycosylase [Idiomarina sp. T82-3]
MSEKASDVKQHLLSTQPGFELVLLEQDHVEPLTPSDMAPIEALPRIVMRQMLSLQASKTIISRVEARAAEQGVRIAQLSYDDLLECGLSRNKAVAVGAIEAYWQQSREKMQQWPLLDCDDLLREVQQIKGVGPWSASILAMFHFAHEDLFPIQDSSLRKAIALLKERDVIIIPDRATPYRSYLACYLWQLLDQKRI